MCEPVGCCDGSLICRRCLLGRYGGYLRGQGHRVAGRDAGNAVGIVGHVDHFEGFVCHRNVPERDVVVIESVGAHVQIHAAFPAGVVAVVVFAVGIGERREILAPVGCLLFGEIALVVAVLVAECAGAGGRFETVHRCEAVFGGAFEFGGVDRHVLDAQRGLALALIARRRACRSLEFRPVELAEIAVGIDADYGEDVLGGVSPRRFGQRVVGDGFLGAQIPDHVLFGVGLEIGIVRVVVEVAAVYARGVIGDGLVVGGKRRRDAAVIAGAFFVVDFERHLRTGEIFRFAGRYRAFAPFRVERLFAVAQRLDAESVGCRCFQVGESCRERIGVGFGNDHRDCAVGILMQQGIGVRYGSFDRFP